MLLTDCPKQTKQVPGQDGSLWAGAWASKRGRILESREQQDLVNTSRATSNRSWNMVEEDPPQKKPSRGALTKQRKGDSTSYGLWFE